MGTEPQMFEVWISFFRHYDQLHSGSFICFNKTKKVTSHKKIFYGILI